MKTPFLLRLNGRPKEPTQFYDLKKRDFIEMNEWKCISQSTQTVKKTLLHMYRWDNNNGGMVEIKKT